MASGGLYLGKVSLTGDVGTPFPVDIAAQSFATLAVADAVLDGCVADSKVAVADAVLDGCVVDGKVAVADAVLDGCVADGKVAVADAVLDGCVVDSKVAVADAVLDGCVVDSKVQVEVVNAPSVSASITDGKTGYNNGSIAFTTGVLSEAIINSSAYKQISFFGSIDQTDMNWGSITDGTTVNLYIHYSQDGTNFYRSSLGAIQFTKVASPAAYQYDFSRDWATAAPYIGFMTDASFSVFFNYELSA